MPIFITFNFGQITSTGGKSQTIEIDSFTFGVENATTIGSSSTGAGAGKATFHEITITKKTDAASSPLLLLACDRGELLPAVQLAFLENNGQTAYLTYDLKDVLISAMHWSSGGDRPTESVSFAFEELDVSYTNEQTGGVTTDKVETGGSFFYPGGGSSN